MTALLLMTAAVSLALVVALQREFKRLERERVLRRLTRGMRRDFEQFGRRLAERIGPGLRGMAEAVMGLNKAFVRSRLRREVYFRGGCSSPIIDHVGEPLWPDHLEHRGGAR